MPEQTPDLAVVDMTLEGIDGIELTRRLTSQCPRVPILIVSTQDEPYHVRKAFEAGTAGYLLKDKMSEDLVEAAETVLDGRQYLFNEELYKGEQAAL